MATDRTEDDLRQLLARAADLPYGDAHEAMLEDVLRRAEAAELTRVAFDTRMMLINAYAAGVSRAKLFVPFARCLADHDRDPDAYEPWVAHTLLWSFKYAVGSMTRFPEVPLAQVRAALDDMERRYAAGGHSMHAVHMYRQRVADHVGDADAAAHWYQRWCAAPRDELSDCIGCEPTSKASYLASLGRDADAIAVAEPVLHERMTCREQPQSILTELLLPYARTGNAEQARAAHRRAYRVLRVLPQDLGSVADHVRFCALTGNEVRGLDLLDRHLGWLERPPSPFDAMSFAAAGALLLRRLVESGHGGLTVRRGTAEISAQNLFGDLSAEALATAARFDARNGTTHQSDRIRALIDAEPVADHLPLSVTPPRRAVPVPAVPPGPAFVDLPPAEVVAEAEAALLRFDERAAQTALDRLRDVDTATDPALDGRIAVLRARLSDDDVAVEADLRRAAELFAAAGDDDRRHSALGRLGALLCQRGDATGGMPLLRAGVAHFADRPDTVDATWQSLRLVHALTALGEHDEARQLLAGLSANGNDFAAAAIAWAGIDLGTDLDAAIEATRTALDGYAVAGVPRMRAVASHRLSELWQAKGDADRALAASRDAVALVPPDAPAELRASLLFALGGLLVRLGRPQEAVPELADAVGIATEGGHQHLAAACRRSLAGAYRDAGQPLDAADVAEDAVAAFEALGDARSADGCRYLLARVQADLDQPAQALARYDEIIDSARERGELAGVAQILVESADLLDRVDRDAEAARRYREGHAASVEAGDPFQAAYCRYQEALSLLWSGRTDDAVAALATADEEVAALPDDDPAAKAWHRAQLDGNAVRVLRAADRIDDAVTRAESALAHFRTVGATQRLPGATLLYGQILLAAGRPADAEPVLREANDLIGSPGAAAALAAALDQLGRTEEAAKVRAAADINHA